ncbi:MAG: stage II sporulation protein P [Firmicutes bacterium]|nr:stage II sporulation protein P [Bacillota bacterium]
MVSPRRTVLCLLVILLLARAFPARGEIERADGYFTLVDREGRTICRTAHQVHEGDQYLAADNVLYEVEEIREDTAHVRFVKRVNLEAMVNPSLFTRIKTAVAGFFQGKALVQGENRPIAIYHTHSAESYVPTDGTDSIPGDGGILQVGESLAQSLREKGVNVIHSKTSHEPHDAMAYDRSRRTAVELLKKNPIALIDLHRDAVPPEEYKDEVNNTPVTKAQLVVGRQNPNRKANEAFAYQVKAAVDRKYPGLVKGIFYGKGKYNQDLAPRLLLVEMGTHTNSREEAERGAAIFAAAAHEVLTVAKTSQRAVGSGSSRAVLWIIGLVGAGVILYLLLNSSWSKIRSEVGHVTGEVNPEVPGEEEPPQEPPGEG